MPTSGSRQHDVEQSRVRSRLEDRGIPDDRAADAARRSTDADDSPAAANDRARGPLGERGGGGDPGDVIELRSAAFSDHTLMPPRHTQADGNLAPPLEWSEPPDGTVELALVCEDLDAAAGPTTLWLVTGIDATTDAIAEATTPDGATTWTNVDGNRGYDGPKPPVGDDPHRYAFRLFALDEPLETEPTADTSAIRDRLDERRTATGTLVGLAAR